MSNIYSIQLLNDLHNHFPDILYSDRIRNTPDLLRYIRQVAQTNPYSRGLNMFNTNYQSMLNTGVYIHTPNAYGSDVSNSIITRLISELMGNMDDVDDLENVPIVPTVEQVTNATIVYPVNGLQDDICTICQDNIESGEVRRITHCRHYFHKTCIDTWFQTHVVCPTCRHDIR